METISFGALNYSILVLYLLGMVGIGFYLVNQMFSYVGIVYSFNPVLSAILPAGFALLVASWMLRRVN